MSSRIVVILHPNTSRIDFNLNDRMFNREKYGFSRKKKPTGREALMLDVLTTFTNGIRRAETSKNSLDIEIEDGFYVSEIIPSVITAIKEFVGESDYAPNIYLDDRRFKTQPVYVEDDFDDYPSGGEKYKPGEAVISVSYVPWEE